MRVCFVAVALCSACSPSLPLATDTVVRCDSNGSCPSGLTCVNGERCVAPALIDNQGAVPINPTSDTVLLSSTPVRFAWGSVSNAASYTLSVATDASMTTLVDQFPMTTTETLVDVTLAPGTYFWRATADTTSSLGAITPTRFGVLGDTVYVYCTDSAACGAAPSADEYGTLALPYRSVERAQVAAQSNGLAKVAVAGIGDGSAYRETLTVRAGISVLGGYDSAFATSIGRTAVSFDGIVATAVSILEPTTISGFAFTNTGGQAGSSIVASIVNSDDSLTFSNCGFSAPLLRDTAIAVDIAANDRAPLIRDSAIDGQLDSAVTDLAATVIVVSVGAHGSLALDNTQVTARGVAKNGLLAGILVQGAATITNSTVSAEAVTGPYTDFDNTVTAIKVEGTGTRDILSLVGSSVRARGSVSARGVDAIDHYVTIHQSRVTAIAADVAASAISVKVDHPLVSAKPTIELSIIGSVLAATHDAAIHNGAMTGLWLTDSLGLVLGNTILVGRGGSHGLDLAESMPRLINNLFVTNDTDCSAASGDDRCLLAIAVETLSVEELYPMAVLNNVFVGFGTINGTNSDDACIFEAIEQSTPACSNVNTFSQVEFTPSRGGNVATTLDALGMSVGADGVIGTDDDDLVPALGSAADGHGTDPTSDTCRGAIGFPSQPEVVKYTQAAPTPSCGGLYTDINNATQTTPPGIGALLAQ